jgi:SecD/SecF fusion protein
MQTMKWSRLIALIVLTVITLGTVAFTTPGVSKGIKLGLDLQGGFEILYKAAPLQDGTTLTKSGLKEAAAALERRANVTGVAEPEVTTEGSDRIRVRLAGVTNPEEVRALMKKPAALTFRSADGCAASKGYCKVELQGTDFKAGGAKLDYNGSTNAPIVQIKLKNATKFEEITTRLVGQNLAIYMDEDLVSAPSVSTPISGGTAIITGQKDAAEAKNLASLINAGALPVKLTEIYTQSVGASLGKQSLKQTVEAGIIGTVLVLLFMIVFYRLPGLIANVTLIAYIWLVLVVTYLMHATLTLPGIAAFVLGIGMAVDANIITAERIKEEMRLGKSLLSASRAGARNSFRTIIDAHVTTSIAAIVLYFVGTGAIQGFSLTLIFSIVCSILTNVFLSRLLLWLLIRSGLGKKPGYYGVREEEISAL